MNNNAGIMLSSKEYRRELVLSWCNETYYMNIFVRMMVERGHEIKNYNKINKQKYILCICEQVNTKSRPFSGRLSGM